MPPSLDKPHVPSGVTEACLMNDHSMCNNPRCGCSCHSPEVNPDIPQVGVEQANPENACPTCGVKRPATELFCRIDGSRLTSLACNMCGRGMNPEDKFCFNCGAPKGTGPKVTLSIPKVVTGPPLEVDEAEVLKGLQEELSNVQVDEANNKQAQLVTEQPAGPQGTFKLVSKPNPNKIRGPVAGKQVIKPSIRLPIKPS